MQAQPRDGARSPGSSPGVRHLRDCCSSGLKDGDLCFDSGGVQLILDQLVLQTLQIVGILAAGDQPVDVHLLLTDPERLLGAPLVEGVETDVVTHGFWYSCSNCSGRNQPAPRPPNANASSNITLTVHSGDLGPGLWRRAIVPDIRNSSPAA